MARPNVARLIARRTPRPVWPIHRPTGSAIAVAISKAATEISTCSSSRAGIPLGPDQCAGSASHAPMFSSMVTIRSHRRRPMPLDDRRVVGPGRQATLQAGEEQVGGHREEIEGDRPDEDLGREERRQPRG